MTDFEHIFGALEVGLEGVGLSCFEGPTLIKGLPPVRASAIVRLRDRPYRVTVEPLANEEERPTVDMGEEHTG